MGKPVNRSLMRNKVARLRGGSAPRVLDLFAGCGGLSLGFDAAGFQTVAAVEIDPNASRSYVVNFHRGITESESNRLAVPRDIANYEPDALLREWGCRGPRSEIST